MSAQLRAAAERALEALTAHRDLLGTMYLRMDAIDALRAALAQPDDASQIAEHYLRSLCDLEDAEWRDKVITPCDGEPYQHWRVEMWLPVPLSATDKSVEAALAAAIRAQGQS